MRNIDIHELFHIINNERTCIGEDRVMPRSQPDFKVCERTVPVKYLDDEGKDEAEDMGDLYSLIFNSPERTQKEKDDPKEMNQDNDICKDFVEHCIQPTQPKTRKYGRSFKETMIRSGASATRPIRTTPCRRRGSAPRSGRRPRPCP